MTEAHETSTAVQLFALGDVADSLLHLVRQTIELRRRHCYIDVQLLCGAGYGCTTLAFLDEILSIRDRRLMLRANRVIR